MHLLNSMRCPPFLTGVVVLGVGVRPAEGAVLLAGEGLAVVDGVLGVAVVGLDVAVDVLVAVVGVPGLGAAGDERAAEAEPADLHIVDVTRNREIITEVSHYGILGLAAPSLHNSVVGEFH